MARRGIALGVVALVALGSACSSDADADPEPTESSTIEAEPETTTPATTATPSTPAPTPAPTTDAPATDAPTTTIDEAAIVADVEAAYFAAFDAYHAAILDPGNEELRAAIVDTHTGPGQEFAVEIVDELLAFGRTARRNPELESYAVISRPVRFENDDRTEATLVACEILSESFFETGSAPGGGDSLLRDDVIRVDVVVVLELTADGWKNAGGETIRELVGVQSCDEV